MSPLLPVFGGLSGGAVEIPASHHAFSTPPHISAWLFNKDIALAFLFRFYFRMY